MKIRSWADLKREFTALVHGHHTPRQIALGFSLGVLVATVAPYGTHLILALVLAWGLRAEKISAALGTFINSPLTVIPIYYLGWVIGTAILGRSDAFPTEAFHEKGVWSFLGGDVFAPLMAGLAVEGVVLAIVSYGVAKCVVEKMRHQHANA